MNSFAITIKIMKIIISNKLIPLYHPTILSSIMCSSFLHIKKIIIFFLQIDNVLSSNGSFAQGVNGM